MRSRARRSRSLSIAPSTDEDLNDLHFALNDRVDRPVITDSDTILPWIRPFDGSNVGLRPRSKRVLLEDTQTLHDAGSRSGGEFAQLPSRCLPQRDPERHASSKWDELLFLQDPVPPRIELLDRCFLDQVPDDLVISLPLRAHLAEQFLRFLLKGDGGRAGHVMATMASMVLMLGYVTSSRHCY